jgi:hypothetical protein
MQKQEFNCLESEMGGWGGETAVSRYFWFMKTIVSLYFYCGEIAVSAYFALKCIVR